MKILWISPFLLHPTDRGGQIRSLGTLRELHKQHHIHFLALNDPANTEGLERTGEYASQVTTVPHIAPRRGSLAMLPQLAGALFQPTPLAVSRYASRPLRDAAVRLMASENFDSIVCDFLAGVPNAPDLAQTVLFEHNVEATIWQRHAAQATNPLLRAFYSLQARRMAVYEGRACRASRAVIAVSDVDAERMRQMFGNVRVSSVPTGVDIDYFRPPAQPVERNGLIFSGSMDWLPNIDAVTWFLREIFPRIVAERPGTTFTIAGRKPDAAVRDLAASLPGVTVTGTVPDMRPYLWQAGLSVVSIRIGGGTRLKIYECMAAGLPVVSTTVGAEGLSYTNGRDLVIADTPESLASTCVRLLDAPSERQTIASSASDLVENQFSWPAVTRIFEKILEQNRLAR